MQGRFIDIWNGGTDRDPEQVVAAMRACAPARLRAERKPTLAERRLWRQLEDRDRMGVAVFRHVPVCVPQEGLERVMTFFIPRFALCVEVAGVDLRAGPLEDALDRMMEYAEQDGRLLEAAGIATMRCVEERVLDSPCGAVDAIRWDLGLASVPGFGAVNLPAPGSAE